MLVSFVVMTYNFERFIEDCVESILNQEGNHDFEVVVVDDASTDGSSRYLNSIGDPRVRVIRHPINTGHVQTANDGIAAARGEIIARIDGDDRYKPWFLDETMPVFKAHPDVGCVYGDVAQIDELGTIVEDPWTGISSRLAHDGKDFKGDEFIRLILQNFLPAPTLIARRSAWDDAMPIPAGFALSDWYVNLRIARRHTMYYRARTLADYRMHSQNLHRNYPRDRSLERTVLAILDQLFNEDDHAKEKAEIRGEAYALAYSILASKYSTWRMYSDAQRCYYQSIRRAPAQLLDPDIVRGFARTLPPWRASGPR